MIREIILFSKNSKARTIHPIIKLLFCLFVIILCGYSNDILFFYFNIILYILLHLYFKSPISRVSKFVLSLTAFYLITGIVFILDGDINAFNILVSRGIANSLAITFLIFTTPLDDILLILSKFKGLIDIVDIAKLMERFVILLEEELALIIKSAKSKGGFDTARKTIRTTSIIAAMLFINTFRKWQEIRDSINSRCYKGKIAYMNVEFFSSKGIIAVFVGLMIVESLLFIHNQFLIFTIAF